MPCNTFALLVCLPLCPPTPRRRCPGKPHYDMAPEGPLLLHGCRFRSLDFQYTPEVLHLRDPLNNPFILYIPSPHPVQKCWKTRPKNIGKPDPKMLGKKKWKKRKSGQREDKKEDEIFQEETGEERSETNYRSRINVLRSYVHIIQERRY